MTARVPSHPLVLAAENVPAEAIKIIREQVEASGIQTFPVGEVNVRLAGEGKDPKALTVTLNHCAGPMDLRQMNQILSSLITTLEKNRFKVVSDVCGCDPDGRATQESASTLRYFNKDRPLQVRRQDQQLGHFTKN